MQTFDETVRLKRSDSIDRTVRLRRNGNTSESRLVTIFDAKNAPSEYDLSSFGKTVVTFGRALENDIILTSPIVGRRHGQFANVNGRWRIEDCGSTNGLIYNNANITGKEINDGDLIRIDDGVETIVDGVLFVFSSPESDNKWLTCPVGGKNEITIGRENCDIILPHISVLKCHAKIVKKGDSYYIVDSGKTNGLSVNGKIVKHSIRLHEKDVISVTNSKLIFTSGTIFYCCYKSGVSVDASDVVVIRKNGRKKNITCNHVSIGIKPGELVGIVGGSGAGKSTVLNCMCGYLKPAQGDVFINGINLYQNFDSLKKLVGYVPQSDIVYDNLTLHDMLMYTAKLRLAKDASNSEREAAIERAINTVELTEKRDSYIKSLSGGQRKRASIAVELLSDPNLLFLDEPASGLDPGTERNLMQSLRKMADSGKTVILVTHSTLQLKLCDKIVFMGKGGRLCFFGSHDEALAFFNVPDIVDIYNLITDQSEQWEANFAKTRNEQVKVRKSVETTVRAKEKMIRQLVVLSSRYLKLIVNDKQRLLLLLLQAPLLAVLISFVADGNQFEQYEMTKSLLFALSCSAFWIGMLNAIQEICKERSVLKREYMTGLSLDSYVLSKIVVLGVLCLVQSLLITGVFYLRVGVPSEGVALNSFIELLLTTFITAVSSTAMGLCVSSLFTNADRAMTVAPLLLMPQILFSGLIFKLSGAVEYISWFAVCRWSMEGYGTSADLNSLPLRLQQEGIMIQHELEDFFEHTVSHLLISWGILILFTVVFLLIARIVLTKINKE